MANLSTILDVTDNNNGSGSTQEVMTSTPAAAEMEESWEKLRAQDDQLPFLESDPYHAIPYIVALSVALFMGIFGNGLIIRAMIMTKKLRILGNEFVINLALSDLCVSLVAEPMCLLGVLKGRKFFERYPWMCELVGCMCLTACLCSFLNLGAVTFSRYMYITHNAMFYRMFTRRRILAGCVLIWITSFLLEMPNFLGWGGHTFDNKQLQCIWNRRASFSYTMFLTVALIGVPLLLMFAAYVRIFVYIYNTKMNVMDNDINSAPELWKKQWSDIIRSSRTMMLVVVMFMFCWFPYVLVVGIDHNNSFPLWTHLWVTYLAHMHSSLSFLVYVASSKDMRRSFRVALGCSNNKEGKYLTSTKSSDFSSKSSAGNKCPGKDVDSEHTTKSNVTCEPNSDNDVYM